MIPWDDGNPAGKIGRRTEAGLERLANKPAAIEGYTATIKRYPFSWYAMLSHARLEKLGVTLPPTSSSRWSRACATCT